MSAPSPGQLRPNSAIYLGAAAPSDDQQSTPPNSNLPLLSPGGTTILGRIPHLPSPPHTISTSGSAGEREKEGGGQTAGNVVSDIGGPGSKQRIILPAVVIMQNGDQDHIGFDNDPKRNYYQQQHFEQDQEDRTARIPPKRSLAEKNKEILDKLDRFSTLGNGRSPGGIMSPASRTISLGRASSASAAAAAAATNSMRHASMTLPPRESRERDVFDRDDHHSSGGRSHSASNSLSGPHSHSTNSNSDMEDRSTTPPATPAKHLIELSQNAGSTNSSPQRKRLVSEPTSPQRLPFLRDRTPNRLSESAVNLSSPLNSNANLSSPLSRGSPLNNTVGRSSTVNSPGSSSLRRMTTLNRSELGTVEEDRDRRSPATRKARTPIPFEFLSTADQELHPPDPTGDRSRQPSPGLYTSEGAPTSPGLYVSEDTGGTHSGSITGPVRSTRRPRPPGIRSSIDRSYEQWEREQTGDAGSNTSPNQPSHESGPETSSIRRAGSAVGVGVRSVVNEGLRAAGLTRPRKVSGSGSGTGAVVASPTVMKSRERMDSFDMTRTGSMRLSSERDRSRSRLDDQREREPLDMDSLRERASRNAFFSPNVRGTRTIHNVLNPGADGSSPGEEQGAIIPASGRETPANLRLFKANYSSTINNSTPALKAYTSPSGTQRHLPSRSVTALNMASYGNDSHSHHGINSSRMPGTPSPIKNSIPLGSASNQSSPSTVNGAGPVNLLQDALWMFESHVQRLPPSNAPEITNDVLRDARGIVQAAVALNGALRGAATVSVDEQIDAETDGGNGAGAADVWRRVGAEFREDARAADELVRALTSFLIGAGRMLRVSSASASHSGHGRMGSINGGEGSVSRAGGSALARGSSVSRAGGSSDGRRSVEGWSLGIGMSGAERRSIDGRRSVEPGAYPGSRRSADDYREDTMRRLTARQGTNDAGSNGSGGSRDRPSTSTGTHRVSFQAYGSGSDSRPTTSLSMRRDLPRISHDEPLVSPGLRTFTSLSSRRSTGHPTPAIGNHKALPRLPLPPQQIGTGGELSFPQSEDGGDRTPIELPRPHMRHSTMPALAVPPPLPTLPSENLINRAKSIGKHAASNSITSASTSSTTRPPLPASSATVRGSSIMPAAGSSSVATTAVTPTTARPREMSFSSGGNDPATSPFSMGRARGSAAVNGLQQVALGNPPRKRTISNADEEYSEEDPRTARLPSANSSSSMSKSGSVSGLGFPSSGSGSPGGNGSTTFEPRRSSVRPAVNRRTSSTLSGASTSTVTSSVMTANVTTPARHRAVTRMSSAGALTLSNPNLNGSRGSLASVGGVSGGETRGSATDGVEEERKLRRSRVRLSLNAVMDKRGGIGELLGGSGRRLTAHVAHVGGRSNALEGDDADVGESPSSSARERRERRRVAEGV